jgi:6,7-dimethyl-8-ribityllumazine synthase
MAKLIEVKLDDSGGRYAIVVARFNDFITGNLLSGALHALAEHGVDVDNNVQVVWVPGAFELPFMAQKLATDTKFRPDAVIALGCVIRGGTPHFEYVSSAATVGLEAVARDTGVPMAFGVLTTDNVEQATVRSSTEPPTPSEPFTKPAPGNKGVEAALTAIEMVNLMKALA